MKIGDHEIEVSTEPYAGGWRSIAFIPGQRARASMTWDSREAAEKDLYQRLKAEFDPPPQFDPQRRYEAQQIVNRRLSQ